MRAESGSRRMKRSQSIAVRRLLGEIGVPLLLLGALDLGFGCCVTGHGVPLPRLFGGDPITAGKFLALRERNLHPPTLDVLLLGTSPMMRVDGQQLEAALGERAQQPVRVFKFSAPYHSFAYGMGASSAASIPARPAHALSE